MSLATGRHGPALTHGKKKTHNVPQWPAEISIMLTCGWSTFKYQPAFSPVARESIGTRLWPLSAAVACHHWSKLHPWPVAIATQKIASSPAVSLASCSVPSINMKRCHRQFCNEAAGEYLYLSPAHYECCSCIAMLLKSQERNPEFLSTQVTLNRIGCMAYSCSAACCVGIDE